MSNAIPYSLLSYQQPIYETVLADRRVGNSRDRKGIGATMFDPFWKACKEVLLLDRTMEERRHGDKVHASATHSIQNLIKLETYNLQRKMDNNEMDKLRYIP